MRRARGAPTPPASPERIGVLASAALHGGLVLAALLAPLFSSPRKVVAISTAEATVIDAASFAALTAAAPEPVSDAPEAPGGGPGVDRAPDAPQPEPEPEPEPEEASPAAAPEPEARPELPVSATPPPPTPVPSEPVRPSIAEVPVPDAPPTPAPMPQSPPSTEPVQPLASRPVPVPGSRPERPPDPEPEPAEAPPPEPPEPVDAPTPEAEIAQEPDAPEGPAPREARLPVARPAEIAAAAEASRETRAPDPEPAAEAQPEPETPEPTAPAAQPGGPSRFARQMTRGEVDGLRLGIKTYFTYAGNRSDRSLEVTLEIALDPAGRIVSGPELVSGRGAPGAQRALFQAGRRALLRAQSAGEFAKLPRAKYDIWQRIRVIFTPDENVGL